MQDCPKCKKRFNLLSIQDYNDGSLKMSDFPTQGYATYCPYCGVNLNSWDAWIGKEVLIFHDEEQLDGLPVILKDVNDDYEVFEVYDQEEDRLYEINSKFVFTPN